MRSGFKAASRTNVLNAKKRIVLRDTLAARGRTGLDLAGAERDDEALVAGEASSVEEDVHEHYRYKLARLAEHHGWV